MHLLDPCGIPLEAKSIVLQPASLADYANLLADGANFQWDVLLITEQLGYSAVSGLKEAVEVIP